MSLSTHIQMKAASGKTVDVPCVGFGTWQATAGNWCKDAVLAALKAGYRHLDCAWMYGVNIEIGEAIRESGVPREEIFITSPHFAAPESVDLALDIILREMGLEYIDLWLIHWNYVSKPISRAALEKAVGGPALSSQDCKVTWQGRYFRPTWKATESLVRNGEARAIGLSNFAIVDVQELLPHIKDVPISCNQIEVHPWLPQNELVVFNKEHGILTTCYSPFAGQKDDGATLLKDPAVLKLAEKNKMDVGQLLQSWAVQRGTVPLGKSSTPARIQSNLQVRELPEDDMKTLNSQGVPKGKGRTVNPVEDWGIPRF